MLTVAHTLTDGLQLDRLRTSYALPDSLPEIFGSDGGKIKILFDYLKTADLFDSF